MSTAALGAGFADPVLDAQAAFRRLLEAMAYVGRPVELPAPAPPPAPLHPATAAIALALIDADTPAWLDPPLDQPAVRDWLRFHCAAPLVGATGKAHFALIAEPAAMPALDAFPIGVDRYPDRSATLVLQLADLDGGAPLALRGPGIKDGITIRPAGLPDWFVHAWRANGRRYPLGVDLLLVSGRRVIGLPRTAAVEG